MMLPTAFYTSFLVWLDPASVGVVILTMRLLFVVRDDVGGVAVAEDGCVAGCYFYSIPMHVSVRSRSDNPLFIRSNLKL